LQPCLNTTKVARRRHILAMVFGKKREKDIVREQSRSISRAQRETERERSKLEREEKKIKEDLKELLRKGQRDAAKTLAKALVANRQQQQRLYAQRAQIGQVGSSMVVARQTGEMARNFGQLSGVLSKVNDSANVHDFMKTMKEYERQSNIMSTKQEYMSDAIDSAMDEDVEESEEVVKAVLDEVNLGYLSRMESVPNKFIREERSDGLTERNAAGQDEEDNFEKRLASLRTP